MVNLRARETEAVKEDFKALWSQGWFCLRKATAFLLFSSLSSFANIKVCGQCGPAQGNS